MADIRSLQTQEGMLKLDEYFKTLCNVLDKLCHEEEITNVKVLTLKDWSNAYTLVYNMCTQKEQFANGQLYEYFARLQEEYLKQNVLPILKTKHGHALLSELGKRWINHAIMKRWLERFFAYLDRYHVQHNGLMPLSKLGFNIFNKIIFQDLNSSIVEAYMYELDKDRKEQGAQRPLLKQVTKIFIELSIQDKAQIYKNFEGALVEKSQEFYAVKHAQWAQQYSCAEYLVNTENLLMEEEKRLEDVLTGQISQNTIKKVLETFNKQIIAPYKNNLISKDTGFTYMLNHEQSEDLSRVFTLFGRLHDNFENITKSFKNFVQGKGEDIVREKKKQQEQSEEKKESLQDHAFVKTLIEFYEKYQGILEKCFPADIYFKQAFKEALEKCLNQTMKVTPAEYIAQFTDSLLKKSTGSDRLTDQERDSFLEKTIGLFSCISDKDMFLDMYKHQLAKRLLQDKSESNDTEKEMISKLKVTCGAQYTSKLEGMMVDIETAHQTNKTFHEWLNTTNKTNSIPDTNVRVLCKAHWPSFKNVKLSLNLQLTEAQAVFKEFYNKNNQFRNLEFVYPLCSITVMANYPQCRTEITMSQIQYTILSYFDNVAGATFGELSHELGIDEDTLKKNLHSLVRMCFLQIKLLEKQPSTKSFERDDVFTIIEKFTTQRKKLQLPTPSMEETYQRARVEEDRGLAIEAATVRVMKSRRVLTYTELIQEVLNILKQFRPDPRFIKKKIEFLIEKEFLERDKEDQTVLRYLA